ncbi:alpha-ketoacid dehydrogenase subunit beta [Microbispora sp. NBC_01189]|uniref:alpha-ketoacid dehydrogenase subunit beta n=1 Tax=Microbispora sp. NBC_01189 TaxID=2903583 RepID=UPI002E146767|nr:alpha-ketoacid dehydrogenase subunit beta [Microbispora sp. NBC_01189]
MLTTTDRVLDNLNGALHTLLAEDPRLFLLGEDVADPYGGAFKVTAGLSTKYPGRVLSTPISENGIVGVANGLALTGNRAIVEMMFGDFAALCFDQILNVSAKSVSMFGETLPVPVVVRVPTGANRGYGPTHSQSLQKHFVGIPDLDLYELSPLHDTLDVLRRMLGSGRPGMFFENKTVYGQRMRAPGPIDELFGYEYADDERHWARVTSAVDGGGCLLIVAGGMVSRALDAARTLLLEDEIDVTVAVASRLYPLDPEPILDDVARARHVFVAEESTPGATWGAEVAQRLAETCWDRLSGPVGLIGSRDRVIPAARHLERRVVVQTEDIVTRVRERMVACAP